MPRASAALLAMAMASSAAFATSARADEDTAYWQNLNVTIKLDETWRIISDTSIRSSDARGLYQIQQSVLLGYKPSKNVTIAAGYLHSPAYDHGSPTGIERRFRQQVVFDNIAKAGPFRLSARVRTEQRWRDGVTGTGWRLRPSLRASAPIAGKVTVTLAHESFINLNTTSFQSKSGFERMRNSVSFGFPVTKGVTFDLGYLNQHAFVDGAPDRVDHIVVTGLSISF